MDEVSPPLAPSQGCEQEKTSAGMMRRRHEAKRHGRSFPSSRSQSGMRAGDDIHQDDGAMARGRAPCMRFPLLSLPVRDASRRRRWWYQPEVDRGQPNQRSAMDEVSHPSSSQSGMRAGEDMQYPPVHLFHIKA